MKKGWTVMYSEIPNVNGRVEDSFSGIRAVKSFTNGLLKPIDKISAPLSDDS